MIFLYPFTGEPEYVQSAVQRKLLNLTGCSVLEFDQEVKPGSYEAWMKRAKQVKSLDEYTVFLLISPTLLPLGHCNALCLQPINIIIHPINTDEGAASL